ncbi:hypothetical protein [Absidia glauca]|uniref:Uncharacterized protein n=1 Tax=Absidia glauca TaxID=4829 RepID=A0A168NHJ1_ABSGL|nr:hypothetical protein [Absidia glauca]
MESITGDFVEMQTMAGGQPTTPYTTQSREVLQRLDFPVQTLRKLNGQRLLILGDEEMHYYGIRMDGAKPRIGFLGDNGGESGIV